MPRLVKNTIILLGLFLAAFVAWVFRPYAKADIALVDPRIRAIEEPYKNIDISFFGDGGSVGIGIVDRSGKTLELCLPAPIDEPTYRYSKLFIGARYYTDTGASEILNSHHTKIRLAEILRSASNLDGDYDLVVYRLSGRLRDSWRYFRREYIFRVYDYESKTQDIFKFINSTPTERERNRARAE